MPIFNVESYLAACLQSIARQTHNDLEVIMVDDGSTDSSAAIASRFSERDERFRLVRQANGGLSNARNTGLTVATGEFLAFVDSDDVLPDDAYERMVRALDASGSDFATGNVQRLGSHGTSQAQFLGRTFARSRQATHVTRFRPLLADRTVWNKLWRRSFWDRHAFSFPEGVVHEDIPVTLPAHVLAASVDVLAAPVYHWRVRDDGAQSITQRRLELNVLRDRLAAVEHVREFLAANAPRKLQRWYDASLLTDDLRLHLSVLDQADAEYRSMFIAGAQPILAVAPRGTLDRLSAIDRLKWHLVGRELEEELVEVLRFQNAEGDAKPPVRRHGRLYGDYPFRGDPRLRIPRSVYRLGRTDREVALVAHLDDVRREGDALRLLGHAHISGLDAPDPRMQRTVVTALPPGRWQALRLRTSAKRLPTTAAHRPDLTGDGGERSRDLSWSGFEADVDLDGLGELTGWAEGTWKLFVHARVGSVHRRRGQFELASPDLIGAVDVPSPDHVRARAVVASDGTVKLEVSERWARVRSRPDVADGALEVTCEIRASLGGEPRLRLTRRSDAVELSYPLQSVPGADSRDWRARVMLADLSEAPASLEAWASGADDTPELWDLRLDGAGRPLAVALAEDLAGAAWRAGPEHELSLIRTRRGDAALVARRTPVADPAPVADRATA